MRAFKLSFRKRRSPRATENPAMLRSQFIIAFLLLASTALRADIPQPPPQHVEDTPANRKQLLTLADLQSAKPPIQGKFGSELVQHERTSEQESWTFSTRRHAGTPNYLYSHTTLVATPAKAAAAFTMVSRDSRQEVNAAEDLSSRSDIGQQRLVLLKKYGSSEMMIVDARVGTRLFHMEIGGFSHIDLAQISPVIRTWIARSCQP